MENKPRTLEEIQGTIKAARDSVWVIEDTLQKLADGDTPDEQLKGNLERNVGHLKLVVGSADVVASGEDISDLNAAIAAGEAKLAEDIWPAKDSED
jgi:hypothetical protein